MAIISVNNVTFSYVDTPILRDASLQLEPTDKIGLIGPNGCGKSTLLKLIIGAIEPDEGSILIRKLSDIGYLEQVVVAADETAFEFCESVFQDVFALEHRMRTLETQMATDQSPEIMQEYGELLESFADLDGYSIKGRVSAVLNGLGMNPSQLMSQMSGGERSKVAMARLLLRQPDVLILDEPTNHLDLQSVSWLEDFLTEYKGAILVVSHDRYFLDKICNKIVKMEFGRTQSFKGNYSEAMRQYREQVIAQNKAYELQQKEIRRQEDMIRAYYNRATELQIKRAKSKQKLLDKVERIEKHAEHSTQFNLNLKSSGRGGNEVLILSGIGKQYQEEGGGEKVILDRANLSVFKDDKIGLIGVNGSGKTTLFRIALGELQPDSGTVKFGSEIKTGYFSQNMESLDFNKTIMEEVHDAYPSMTLSEVRGKLGAFMFKDDLDRKVGLLSGGERSRIQLLKLMLSPANLLLLDEPTNHLDIDSKELLDEALEKYEGSFITISHDRFFLNAVCNKIAKLENGNIRMFEGNYDDYLEVVKREEERERLKSEAESTPPKPSKTAKKTSTGKKRSKKAIEADILALEERIHELELSQFEEHVYNDYQKMREVTEEIQYLKQKCEECYNELFE